MDKRQYDLNERDKIFTSKKVRVPSNEEEFRKIMMSTEVKIPTKFIKDALLEVGISEDELEEDYADKSDKIELFLKTFDVIYSNIDSYVSEVAIDMDENIDKLEETSKQNIFVSLETAKEFFEKEKKNIKNGDAIKVISPNIKEKMDISIYDNFVIQHKNINIFSDLALLISDDKETVIAAGKIIKKNDNNKTREYFIAEKKNIDFSSFGNSSIFGLVLLSNEYEKMFDNTLESDNQINGTLYVKKVSIEVEKMQKTRSILCIDFGTSNTTVGTYGVNEPGGIKPEIVEFVDSTKNNNLVKLCPTMVYVQDCSDVANVKFLFGYDAKKKVIENNYDMIADVFYEIKSWIGDTSKIKLRDEKGKLSEPIEKCRVAKAYIDYIIEMAQDYFKVEFLQLHFTAPVKMKSIFIQNLKNMFKEDNSSYTICNENDSIDEAVAIIYDYLYEKQIVKFDELNSFNGNIVVLDCGGGTTDLATCTYSTDEVNESYIRIQGSTKFENGNSIYGGNNITYKIMQLIKIKICKSYGKISDGQYDEIFKYSEKDILSAIDIEFEKNKNYGFNINSLEIYKKFNKLYDDCEKYIPTRFADNSDYIMDDDRKVIKRNFYYLWQLAEMVKLDFYKKEEVQVNFENSAKMLDIPEINNSIYISKGDELIPEQNPTQGIKVTITDIRKIICGDIYILLNNILPKNPETYDYYELSGQSCKINLFNELLKEFIPGKKLRSKLKQSKKDENSVELKLKCITGSINYMAHKEHGKCEININSAMPKLIYNVFYEDDQECPLFDLDRKNSKVIYLTSEQKYIDITIRRLNGEVVRKCTYARENNKDKFKVLKLSELRKKFEDETSLKNIEELIGKIEIAKSDISNQLNMEIILPSKDGYGFMAYCLIKYFDNDGSKSVNYCISQGKYFNYEEVRNSFFDGRR